MLKVAFPLSISDTVATYEIPYGSIERSTRLRTSWEKAQVEVSAQRWADVSTEEYGVSLLNAGSCALPKQEGEVPTAGLLEDGVLRVLDINTGEVQLEGELRK